MITRRVMYRRVSNLRGFITKPLGANWTAH